MDQKSDSWSFNRNFQCSSRSRKISVGILADSASNTEGNDVKEAGTRLAQNGNSDKRACFKHHEQKQLLVGQTCTNVNKNACPDNLRSCLNLKMSPSPEAYEKEHSPSFQVISQTRVEEKSSADNCITPFAAMAGSKSDILRQKCTEKATDSVNSRKSRKGCNVEDVACLTEPTFKEYVEDKGTPKVTEALTIKLRKNLESLLPSKLHPSYQSVELLPDQDLGECQSPVRKINLNSDTIESDSERQISKGLVTRCLAQKKVTAKHGHSKIAARKPTCARKDSSEKNKIIRELSRVDMLESFKHGSAQKIHQSEKKCTSMSANEKFVMPKDKVLFPNTSNDRRCQVLPKSRAGAKEKNSFNSPDDVIIELQKDVEWQMDAVETDATINKNRFSDNRPPNMINMHKDDGQAIGTDLSNLKDLQMGISDSLSKKRRSSAILNSFSKKRNSALSDSLSKKTDCADGPSIPPFGPGSPTHLNLLPESPAEKIFSSNDVMNFKRLSSSKSEPKLKNLNESSMKDGRDEANYSLLKKPSSLMEVDFGNHLHGSSTDAVGSDSSADNSPVKGHKGSVRLSPKDCSSDKFLHDSNRSLTNEKDDNVDRCTPVTDLLDEIKESNLKMCVNHDVDDGLASAVSLLTVALVRLKAKLNSMTRRRSDEILVASADGIHSLLQNAESQVKTDMGKLINISDSKRKLLETKFKDKLEHVLETYKRFKEEVDRQLQDCGSVTEDLGEYEDELKRALHRQRASHKKFLSQLEQDIRGQVQDAESRIMGVHELAREKMLQLKLVVAESVKYIVSS